MKQEVGQPIVVQAARDLSEENVWYRVGEERVAHMNNNNKSVVYPHTAILQYAVVLTHVDTFLGGCVTAVCGVRVGACRYVGLRGSGGRPL